MQNNPNWRENAACKGMDTNLFFPIIKNCPEEIQAKKVCATCPVKRECREEGMSGPRAETYGIWGQLTERDRDSIRRSQRKARRKILLSMQQK